MINFKVQNLGGADCGLSFDMVSPAGQLLGTGVSCTESIDGCEFAGCLETVHATFTLEFDGGTLTLPVVLNERWLTDPTVRQIDTGTVIAGTGDFAGASGSLFCAGTVRFTATGVILKLPCVLHIT